MKNTIMTLLMVPYTKVNTYFEEHPNAIAIILYNGKFEVCNPLGSHASKHKIDMYYYCVANMSTNYPSQTCAV